MEILLLILLYPIFTGIVIAILNDKALIPGTTNYKRKQMLQQEALNVERARTQAIEARYRARENEQINQMLQIEGPKHDS